MKNLKKWEVNLNIKHFNSELNYLFIKIFRNKESDIEINISSKEKKINLLLKTYA